MIDWEERCKQKVSGSGSYGAFHEHRCNRRAVKDGFCTIHHPNYLAQKAEKQQKKWDEELIAKRAQWRLERAAPLLLEALKDLVTMIEAEDLIPPTVSYMKQAKEAIQEAEKI